MKLGQPFQENSEVEEDKVCPESSQIKAQKDRKNYLKKTGKSLWMKNKQTKTQTLSLEVTTKSSENSTKYDSYYYAARSISI